MSSSKFSSCLSCLSYFNFFSKCFKPNRSENSEELMPLLGNKNNGDSSQNGSDKSTISISDLVVVLNDLKNSNDVHSDNQKKINLEQTNNNTLSSISNTSNSSPKLSLTLSGSSCSSITQRSHSSSPIEISQSPELSFSRSDSREIDPRVIFTKSPSQILRENNSNELSQNQTQSMFDKIVGYSNSRQTILPLPFQRRTISTLCLSPEDSPSKSQDPRRLSTYRRISSQIQSGLLDPLERRPSEISLRPGTKIPLKNSATIVSTSKAVEVATRIQGENGQRVCNF